MTIRRRARVVLRLAAWALTALAVLAAGVLLAGWVWWRRSHRPTSIEPVYPGDAGFLDLLDRTHRLTRGRGAVLSVSVEQLELVNGTQTVAAAVLPHMHYPPRPSRAFLEQVARRVDRVAIMAYDTGLPADWLVGWHFAWQAEHVTELIGDQVTVLIGVPTYGQDQPFAFAENLRSATRGVRRGLDRLHRQPARSVGLAGGGAAARLRPRAEPGGGAVVQPQGGGAGQPGRRHPGGGGRGGRAWHPPDPPHPPPALLVPALLRAVPMVR